MTCLINIRNINIAIDFRFYEMIKQIKTKLHKLVSLSIITKYFKTQ
jgi:hypothetical protein